MDTTNAKNICNPTEGDVALREQGKTEFHKFVQKTFDALFKIESQVLGGKSSIGVFCRMDVGIIVTDYTGEVQYFVNEIERTPTTSLWANEGLLPIGTFGTTFAKRFHSWLTDVSSPASE